MFSSIKIAIFMTMFALGAAGLVYVKNLKSDLEIARANVAKMEVAIATSEASIKTLQADAAKMAELNQQLSADLQKAEQYGDELRATLQKHNLTHLANKKPGLIQEKMQNATNKLWDDLESITSPVDPSGVQQSEPVQK